MKPALQPLYPVPDYIPKTNAIIPQRSLQRVETNKVSSDVTWLMLHTGSHRETLLSPLLWLFNNSLGLSKTNYKSSLVVKGLTGIINQTVISLILMRTTLIDSVFIYCRCSLWILSSLLSYRHKSFSLFYILLLNILSGLVESCPKSSQIPHGN